MTKPTEPVSPAQPSGAELPNAEGRWQRDSGQYDVLISRLFPDVPPESMWACGFFSDDNGRHTVSCFVDCLPRGHWHPATPAAAATIAELREQLATLTAERDEARQRLLTAAGDDLCRLSQEEIKAMSLGAVPIPPKDEFLASCERFHSQVAGEAGVNTGCLTLAQLVAENEKLRAERDAANERAEWLSAEVVSMLRDIARRIGVARNPLEVKTELEALANKLERWAKA